MLLAALLLLSTGHASVGAEEDQQVSTAIEAGRASWVAYSYGDRYLALPRSPRGTRVRVCGTAGCVIRTSNDVGPDQSVHPDRIADLSRRDFETVSGLSTPEHGTALVTVEFLDRVEAAPGATLPPTDTE